MLEYPVYIRLATENDKAFFENRSCAEAVIVTLINAQQQGWLRLHGFVLLPNALEMVASVIRQGVSGVIAHIQAESIPPLSVLLPDAGWIWSRNNIHTSLTTQTAFEARLNILLLSPVAHGLVDSADLYPYSSANARYSASVAVYAGFQRTAALPGESRTMVTVDSAGAGVV